MSFIRKTLQAQVSDVSRDNAGDPRQWVQAAFGNCDREWVNVHQGYMVVVAQEILQGCSVRLTMRPVPGEGGFSQSVDDIEREGQRGLCVACADNERGEGARERGARALTVSFAHRLVAGPPMPAAKKRRTRAALKGGGLPMSFDFSLIQDTAAEGLFYLRPAVKLARALCQQNPLHLWLKSRNSISDVPLIADLRVLREFYKTPEGKAVLKEAGFGEEGCGAYEIDHIYPRSPSCPGSGINHVCNLFLLSPAENQFFRDHADLLKVKMHCIGEVLCTFSIFLHCNALLHLIA